VPDVVQSLRRLLDDRERRSRELRVSRVTGRDTDGTLLLADLDGECIARGCRTAEASGETVKRPLGPCWDTQGAAGVAGISVRAGAGVLWVESIAPDVYAPGESYLVEVVGRGFTAATEFEFLLPGSEEVNEDVSITSKELIDSEHYELMIDVSAAAASIVRGDLGYDDGGRVN
jgi:hypothetical protein